jgi:hypothetical protein
LDPVPPKVEALEAWTRNQAQRNAAWCGAWHEERALPKAKRVAGGTLVKKSLSRKRSRHRYKMKHHAEPQGRRRRMHRARFSVEKRCWTEESKSGNTAEICRGVEVPRMVDAWVEFS